MAREPFDDVVIKEYPKSCRRISLEVAPYNIRDEGMGHDGRGFTTYISPQGIEFQVPFDFAAGTLLRILLSIPNYWERKQRFVSYNRIDCPDRLKILGRVVRTSEVSKRSRKRIVTVQTVNIDEIDERVLESFIQDGKS